MSMHRKILESLKTKLEELTWQKSVEFETIKLFSSDFNDDDLPGIQIYDVGEVAEQVQGRHEIRWDLTVEVIMKNNVDETVNQGLLFDRRLEVIRKIGEDPTLGLQNPGAVTPSEGRMIHIKYHRGLTDLHVLDVHHMARLNFQVLFEEPFSSEC